MEAKVYGVRSVATVPLHPGDYAARLARLLLDYKNMETQSPEDFLAEHRGYLPRMIGGNTACLSVQAQSGHILVLDAGSGLFSLGQTLMQGACGEGQGEVHIFLSHLHLDRISGLFHFAPFYVKKNQIHFYFPEENLDLRLIRIFSPPYHEHSLDSVPADLYFHALPESSPVQIGSLSVEYAVLLHPGSSYAYRFQEGASCLVYAGGGKLEEAFYREDLPPHPFLSGAQVLFLDARPAVLHDEPAAAWGHTDYKTAIGVAKACRAKHLFLFNHPPELEDRALWQAYFSALDLLPADSALKVHLAREGQRIRVGLG